MENFRVGDRVVRLGDDYKYVVKGRVYEVKDTDGHELQLFGVPGSYMQCFFIIHQFSDFKKLYDKIQRR